jgi:hypothetical protein
VYPKAPDKLPDGATASKEQMVAAMALVRAYDGDIKTYTDCLQQEHDEKVKAEAAKQDSDKSKMTKEQRDQLDNVLLQKHNAAIDADTALTTRFNEQVRAFKAKSSDKKS